MVQPKTRISEINQIVLVDQSLSLLNLTVIGLAHQLSTLSVVSGFLRAMSQAHMLLAAASCAVFRCMLVNQSEFVNKHGPRKIGIAFKSHNLIVSALAASIFHLEGLISAQISRCEWHSKYGIWSRFVVLAALLYIIGGSIGIQVLFLHPE